MLTESNSKSVNGSGRGIALMLSSFNIFKSNFAQLWLIATFPPQNHQSSPPYLLTFPFQPSWSKFSLPTFLSYFLFLSCLHPFPSLFFPAFLFFLAYILFCLYQIVLYTFLPLFSNSILPTQYNSFPFLSWSFSLPLFLPCLHSFLSQ